MASGLPLAIVFGWLVAVAWSDWTRLRISNRMVGGAAAFLLAAALLDAHPAGLSIWMAAGGALIVLGAGVPLFAMGWVGAGDVKLLAVLGALVGPTGDLLIIWAGASVLAALHLGGWRLLRLRLRELPLSPADPGSGTRRRLPHGLHLAMAAALVVTSMKMLPP
ncbi:MAG: prepilin peptidase [Comamonadaceae bacterium]|nr:MAG: prepilin peptidase [Comamonadaceae bacterium]